MTDMTARTVLTTGANSGIGLATTIELARRGYRSVGTARSEAKAELIHEAAAAAGVKVETVILDVTDAEQCEKVVTDLELFGLVNNAGFGHAGAIEDVDDDEARLFLETMVLAPMRLARLAIPVMRARGDGRIVNISSITGLVSSPLTGWYTASKHALEGLSDALRNEVARDGIKVAIIEPGGFKTGIWAEMESSIERREAAGTRHAGPYQRALQLQRLTNPVMGVPESCAGVIADAIDARHPRSRYLVGRDAAWLKIADAVTPTMVTDRLHRLFLGL